ncbi:MAG: hypothetical protein E7171_07030 [Firmicutes bacterium]|nr:hypothetical protein [Bacillota bacterium]
MVREKKKSAGPLTGLLMIVIGIVMLWINESNNVKNIKTIEEARGALINISSDKVDSANEGKLVSTNGKLVVEDEYLVDSMFNVQSPKTAKLVRVVEMLQWVEVEHSNSDDTVTYDYELKWLTDIEDSSDFRNSSKVNPTTMPYEEETFYAANVTLGAFTISDAQKELLSTGAAVALGETVSLPTGYYKVNNYIASVDNLANAKVGDVRISFRYNNDKEISILAKQSGSSFLPFTSKQGKNMFEVRSGIMTGEAIIDAVEKENNILKWILRFIGTVLNMAGFAALLSPIAFLVKWIPLLGKGIAKVIGWIGGLVGFAVSLIVIAIAWLFFRPLVAILLFVGVGGSIALVAMLIKKSRGMEDPNQVAVAGVPGMTMAMPTDGVQPMMQQPVVGQPMVQPQVVQQQVQPQTVMQPQMMPQQQVQPQVVQQPVMQPQQSVNPLEQQQIQAAQNALYEQQMAAQQPQQDPMNIFGQNNNQQ